MGTDDLDSQGGISLLNQVFGYEQNGYVTRDGIYVIDTEHRNHIGVDLAMIHNRKTYDNHVTMLNKDSFVNPNSANVNAIMKINQKDNYTQKCAFSTMLQIYSLFDIPLPKTDEGKMFLLSIDSSHLGHYAPAFKRIHNEWLEKLDLTELIDILNKYSKAEISNMRKGEKLTFENNILTYNKEYKDWAEKHLGYEIILPKGEFTQVVEFKQEYDPSITLKLDITHDKNVFSCAMTTGKHVSYSRIKKIIKPAAS
ncbi:hypothetical protein [Lysinibacillus sp. FSL P2-0066]|uniref:hypothetical protein n=1 Tax=Lysinibacillus sp. FSL P2-0066 TaxID=2921720 RepID=UPI0030D9F8F9